jgi:alginate O-acetyltransferase complex protein AlgI
MLFQSSHFLYLMTAVVIGLLILRTRTLQQLLILVASWFFYASWDLRFLPLLLFCTVNDYILGLAIHKAGSTRSKRIWLVVSLITNLGLLAVFKYCNFVVETVNALLRWQGSTAALLSPNIALPIGISFYTFHSMGYNIDVYRGKKPELSFLRFAIYVAYFPQLVAGPILRAGQFLPQLANVITFRSENVRSGANLFLTGMVKKVVVADNIAPLVDKILNSPEGIPSLGIWFGVFCFGIQIYCDFSGYTDMARGISRMFGIEIPINFEHPYFATNITEFWRRWHISLSTWLRDYLYIPLGGNRVGVVRVYLNLMIVMGLGGLWHGASWNFVLWGLYQGVLLCIERALGWHHKLPATTTTQLVTEESNPESQVPVQSAFSRLVSSCSWILRWGVCQYFVFLGWVLFRVSNTSDLLYCVRKYVLFDRSFQLTTLGLGAANPFTSSAVILGFCVLHAFSYRVGGLANFLDRSARWQQFLVWVLAVLALIQFWPQQSVAFIYFQF